MRDSLLDGFIEPMVHRLGIDPVDSSYNAARMFGALIIASNAARFDRENGLWFEVTISFLITILLAKMLIFAGRIGPSILDTPLGYVHFGLRLLYLILFLSGICNITTGLAMGMIEPSLDLMWQSIGITGLGFACASMYLGACRSGRPSRPNGGFS